MADKKIVLLVVLAALLVSLPFVNKPVHLDDWVFITGAQRLCQKPWGALEGTIVFFGSPVPFWSGTHPPLLFLYAALIDTLVKGPSEAVRHIFYLPFSVLAAVSIFFLARRFVGDERRGEKKYFYLTMLAVFTPAFMVASHSLMADLPTLAFGLAGLVCYIRFLDEGVGKFFWPATLFCTLAVMASYQGFFIFALLFLYAFLNKKGLKYFFAVCLLPLVSLGVWFFLVYRASGQIHLWSAFFWGGLRDRNFLAKPADTLVGFLCVIGAVTVFPLSMLAAFFYSPSQKENNSAKPRRGACLPAGRKQSCFGELRPRGYWPLGWVGLRLGLAGLTVYLCLTRLAGYSWGSQVTFAVFFCGGVLSVERAWTYLTHNPSRDRIFLCLWFLGYLFAAALLLPQGISRYFLLGLFPLLALFALDAGADVFWPGVLAATLSIGVMVSAADYRAAAIDQNAAFLLSRKYAADKLCYAGELGFRYYMEESGFQYVASTQERLLPGQKLVEPDSYLKAKLSGRLRLNLVRSDRMVYRDVLPLTVMSEPAKADIYSSANGYGFLPYAWGFGKAAAVFTIYDYADTGNLRVLSARPGRFGGHPVPGGLFLLSAQPSQREFVQGESLSVALRWLASGDVDPDLCTWLLLKSPDQKVLLSHGPLGKQGFLKKGEPTVFGETYFIKDLTRDIFPGEYELYAGAIPAGNADISADDFVLKRFPGIKLGTIKIRPRSYPADPALFVRPGYWPRPNDFAIPPVTFTLSPGAMIELPMIVRTPVKSLGVVSFLAYADKINTGAKVAAISVIEPTGQSYDLVLRAGRDTADWSLESPAYQPGVYRHAKAKVFSRWAENHQGRFFWGYRYFSSFMFTKPIIPAKIIVRYLGDNGVLVVDALVLF